MQYDLCEIYAKTEDGTDPETLEAVDGHQRRIAITPIGDRRAVEMVATGRYQRQPTHQGLAEYDGDLQPMRYVKRLRDEAYFYIVSTRPHGRFSPGARHAKKLRLILSYDASGLDL